MAKTKKRKIKKVEAEPTLTEQLLAEADSLDGLIDGQDDAFGEQLAGPRDLMREVAEKLKGAVIVPAPQVFRKDFDIHPVGPEVVEALGLVILASCASDEEGSILSLKLDCRLGFHGHGAEVKHPTIPVVMGCDRFEQMVTQWLTPGKEYDGGFPGWDAVLAFLRERAAKGLPLQPTEDELGDEI